MTHDYSQGRLVLNIERATQYTATYDEAVDALLWLTVISAGGSARASEVAVELLKNTATSKRSLYVDPQTGCMVLGGHYNKVMLLPFV